MSDQAARLAEAERLVNVALDRLLAQDSWEQPHVIAARDALIELARVSREAAELREALLEARRTFDVLLEIGPENSLWRNVASVGSKDATAALAAAGDRQDCPHGRPCPEDRLCACSQIAAAGDRQEP